MIVQSPMKRIFAKYSSFIQQTLQDEIENSGVYSSSAILPRNELKGFYGQICYHLGWVDQTFSPVQGYTGKLLRPTLLLLAYEAAGSWGLTSTDEDVIHLHRALPAACAIELFHNFTLMHDDIEDGDRERRYRPTAWAVFGVPHAVNTGDGISCLSHLALFKLLDTGVNPDLVARLGSYFDRAALSVIEGQYLDLHFETLEEVTVPMYLEMITRKTALLMACAAEMGGMLGTEDLGSIEELRQYGLRLGIAFQMRDDLSGIWATQQKSGKMPAGDLMRRKKTLPILHAINHASPQDQTLLRAFYSAREEPTEKQVTQVLSILERTRSRYYCQDAIKEQCELARGALTRLSTATSPIAQEAVASLATLVSYVEEDL
jgi:geranylgeranyl diphosphate synthase, type I